MSIIIVLLVLFFVTLIGYTVIVGFNFFKKESGMAKIAYSYGLGVGLISYQLYLYSEVGIPWRVDILVVPILLFVAIIWFVKRNKEFKLYVKIQKIPPLGRIDKILIACIVLTCCYVIFEATLRPVTTWDGWAIWLMKSKIFFLDGSIHAQNLHYIRSDYPLVISLFGTFVYILIGHVDDSAVLLTSSAFYVFLSLLFFAKLKERFGISYALVFTFLLVTTQTLIRQGGRLEAGEADLPLGYYIFTCVMIFFSYLQESKVKDLILLILFLGITTMVKFEGIPFVTLILLFMAYHLFIHRQYKHFPLLFFALIPFMYWELYLKQQRVEVSYFAAHHYIFSLRKIFNSVLGAIKEFLNIKSWNILWLVYFVTLCRFGVKKNGEKIILTSVVFLQLTVYLALYFFTANNEPESSFERLLVHIAPVAFYYIAIEYGRVLFLNKINSLYNLKVFKK